MDTIEEKLAALGLSLPEAPAPGGNYLPYRISGNQLILAGVICVKDGEMTHTGQVGDTQSIESGYEAARVCALNVLAAIKGALGSFDRVSQFLYMGGYVNAVAGFDQSPQVVNGASDLFAEVFGEKGKHARAAVAVAGLPKNSTVELQTVIEFT
ncbi:MAG: RidA family protein [Oceanipulchritudo sp.]